jgi:hypothetical protein
LLLDLKGRPQLAGLFCFAETASAGGLQIEACRLAHWSRPLGLRKSCKKKNHLETL